MHPKHIYRSGSSPPESSLKVHIMTVSNRHIPCSSLVRYLFTADGVWLLFNKMACKELQGPALGQICRISIVAAPLIAIKTVIGGVNVNG